MKKYLISIIVCLASFLCYLNTWANSLPEYANRIEEFLKITSIQVEEFSLYLDDLKKSPNEAHFIEAAKKALQFQHETQATEVEKIKLLYKKIFIEKTGTKEDRKALVYQESNLSIATQRQLEMLKSFIQKQNKHEYVLASELNKMTVQMRILTTDLKEGKSIEVPASMGIGQVFQANQKFLRTLCTMAAGFCTRASLSKLMDSLDETRFLRNRQSYQYENIDPIKQELSKNEKAVFILIGNHDQPLMDIALARKVALKLGSDQHITMTRKSVYPIPPPESAGDVVFVVDNDPKSNPVQESLDILNKNILQDGKSRVSLAVYPEGMLPYTGGQMPMTVKEGAFVIARKMAAQLEAKGIPVYLVQMKTNIIEHLTAIENIPAKVKMEFIEKVPSNPIDKSKPDLWIESKRIQAENSFNSHRGITQMDIFNLDKAPHSKIPYGIEMRKCSKIFTY